TVVAWRGPGQKVGDVGLYAFGVDNPRPDRELVALELENPGDSHWALMGLTLSDGPHFFPPPLVSTIPAHWAAAHVFKAFMEGLVGVVSSGKAFETATLQPRWALADVAEVEACAKYVPSQTYLSYRYRQISAEEYLIRFATTAMRTRLRLWLPDGKPLRHLEVNGEPVEATIEQVENARYAVLEVEGVRAYAVRMQLG
ncbi:MAG: hypothetical protein D6722_02205, partial [Bacteroidetes bacterium]